jgi:hypothetical protein
MATVGHDAYNEARYKDQCMGLLLLLWGWFSYLYESEQYINILKEHIIPSAQRLFNGQKYLFQSDNDPKHTSKKTARFMKQNKIDELLWPSQSPDLNPIENLWAYLNKRARLRKCRNKQELFDCLQEEWKKIPLDVLRKHIDSMPRRCQAVMDNKGWPTKY